MRIVEILQTVLPPNVVQAVPAAGSEIPQLLATHPLIKKISLTGSTAAGAAAAKSAATHVIPSTLELGGKNAFLIFEDADLDRAVADALEGAFFNKGEACTASSRLLVHNSVHDVFVERLAKLVQRLVVGNGLAKETHVGPSVSKAQQQRVLNYIEIGKAEGATIEVQASLPSDPACKDGYFVPVSIPPVLKNRDSKVLTRALLANPLHRRHKRHAGCQRRDFWTCSHCFEVRERRRSCKHC